MKSEQKRIKHWLRTQQNKQHRDYPFIPNIDFWTEGAFPRIVSKIIALNSIANKLKK